MSPTWRPARYLARVAVAAAWDGTTKCRTVPDCRNLLYDTDFSDDPSAEDNYCQLVVVSELSDSDVMPDKGKNLARKRRRDNSRDRDYYQDGRRQR